MRRNPIPALVDLVRRHGDVAFFRAAGMDVFVLSHPDDIQGVLVTHNRRFHKGRGLEEARRVLGQGLLTSEGELHRRQRRMIQPVFHHARIAGYGRAMVDQAVRMREGWPDGHALDVNAEMMRLTLTVVGSTLFAAEVEEEAPEIGRALAVAVDMFDRLTVPWGEQLMKLPLPRTRRFLEAKARLDRTIYRLIDERRATGDRGDLLSMLLAAQDEETGGGMSDEQVRDEAMTIFLAGHETTAQALTWTWYLLSQNPAVEERLHAELDEVLGGRPPTVEDLPALPYTERVVAESMRLYPPAWILGRRAVEEHPVRDYVVPPGAIVVASQYVVHHDPRWWPDPFRFDPDRFLPEAGGERPRFSYFPFGAGPRVCIGESFAWMEAQLLLATLASRWRLRLVPGHPVDLLPRITLRPRHGMRMVLHRRAA